MGAFFRIFAGAVLGVWALGAVAAAAPPVEQPPADPDVIRWDPAIRQGVLSNGLRYAVMHNATPAGGVSIRLVIGVGSLDDPDDQLGAAHFLEHMAFGGSQAQLQPDIESKFAAAGVAFGRDRNAHTEAQRTTYEIDLPHGQEADLDLGFKWLRQVADGARITAETVEAERGVILAEREVRLSALEEANERIIAFQLPGTLAARGPVIGTKATITAMTAAELQALYQRWYQPQNAAVVVVGDEPLEALEARVRDAFGGWRASDGAVASTPSSPIDAGRGLDTLAIDEAHLPPMLGICRARPSDPTAPDDMASLRQNVTAQMWAQIITARLVADARAPSSGVVSARVLDEDIRGQARLACVVAVTASGAWRPALSTVRRETQLLSDLTPSQDEFLSAIAAQRAILRTEVKTRDTRDSTNLAERAGEALIERRALPSPAEAMRAFDVAVEGMTPDDIRAAFRRDWAGSGPLIYVVAPQTPAPSDIRAAWTSEAPPSAPAPPAAANALVWGYAKFGRSGTVVRRKPAPDGAFVKLTFANGVRLNFKHTDFQKSVVEVRVGFGGGMHALAPADYGPAQLGSVLFARGGLGRHSYADLMKIFAESAFDVKLLIRPDTFVLSSPSSTSSLGDDLSLLAAYVTDPGFRDLGGLLTLAADSGLKTVRAYPNVMISETLLEGVAPDSPRTAQAFESHPATGSDVVRVLRPYLIEDPLEVTIVGDVAESVAIADVARTFGALAARKPIHEARPDAWFLRFPQPPPATLVGYHDGPQEKAATALVWPLYVAEPARRREEYALQLVALVYQEAMLRRIRGDLSKTYAPQAATSMPDGADQGMLTAEVETTAGDLDQVRSEMTKIAAQIARGDFTDADIDTVRNPLLTRTAKTLTTNRDWADALEVYRINPAYLTEFEQLPSFIASITPAEVRKAAADWMGKAPIAVVVTARPSATPTSLGQAKP
jgi:zinc protease